MVLVAVGLVGLMVGSFANVLIARVPTGEDWVRGSSHCPKCRHDLAWFDNIPLFSWLWLRRKCRYCRAPISGRYPLVEALVAALFVAVYLVYGVSFASAALWYLAIISVALVFIDLDVQRLPDALVLPTYPVVAALLVADAAVVGEWAQVGRAGIGLAIMAGFYGLMWVLYPAGMGLGDVKAAGLLGMAAGYLGWSHLGVAAIAGPIIGGLVVAVGLTFKKIGMKSRVAYGPALIAGAWVGYLVGPWIAHAYVGLVT